MLTPQTQYLYIQGMISWAITATHSVLAAVTCAAMFVAILWPARRRLIDLLRKHSGFRGLVYGSEPLLAALLSIVAVVTELWKLETWEADSGKLAAGLILWSLVLTGYIAIRVLTAAAIANDEKETDSLRRELMTEKTSVLSLRQQRDKSTQVATLVRKLDKKKIEQLSTILAKHIDRDNEPLSKTAMLRALHPAEQIRLSISSLHQFFATELASGETLRLAVLVRDPVNEGMLDVAISFDGEKRSCFDLGEFRKHLRLINPAKTQSAMVQCFHGAPGVKIISDARQTLKEGSSDSSYLVHELQASSLCLYKHIYSCGPRKDALVLMLVSSQVGLFKSEQSYWIEGFLAEMMSRIEYEWIVQEMLNCASRSRRRRFERSDLTPSLF